MRTLSKKEALDLLRGLRRLVADGDIELIEHTMVDGGTMWGALSTDKTLSRCRDCREMKQLGDYLGEGRCYECFRRVATGAQEAEGRGEG